MNRFSAVRLQDQHQTSEPPIVLHDIEIVGSEPFNPKWQAVSDPVRIRALIGKIQVSEPTRAYQQSGCHHLVRTILAECPCAGMNNDAQETLWAVSRTSSGAPCLMRDGLPSGLHVSMAHSGPWIAVVLAQGAAVGIDIEATKPRDNFAAMAKYMGWADRVESTEEFLSCWTLWEACVKLEGTGIFNSRNAAFDALQRIERDVLAQVDQWAGLTKHIPQNAHFALAIHHNCQAPLEIKGF